MNVESNIQGISSKKNICINDCFITKKWQVLQEVWNFFDMFNDN